MCYNSFMERFLDYFEPEQYILEECFWRSTETFSGKVEIIGRLRQGYRSIKLHAVGLEVDSVEWYPWDIDEDDPEYFSYEECPFTYRDDVIEIPISDDMQHTLDEIVHGDNRLSLRIKFKGFLSRNMQGCYLSTYNFNGEEQRLIATQFESHYAREAFPCIDEPAAKATFALTIILPDFSEKDVVLANTPAIGQVNGKFEFTTTPRMSTYLLAWVAGPLKSVSTVNQNGVKVSSYCALNQPVESLLFANETAARALEYYDAKFEEKYPLPKLDQVALPDFEAGAMENWGLVTYRESMMLADKTATVSTKQSIAITVTHELSHQWFGDLVTMAWWDDLWLNESFASVMEFYATDALYPEYNIWQDFFTNDCLAALKRDSMPGVQSVKQAVHHPAEIATLFDSAIVYAKGAHLIYMLIKLMGEEKFDRGIADYFNRHKYENTVGDELWAALQPYADFDVKDFMNVWITQPGYPALKHQDGNWSQRRFLITGGTDDSVWPLPEVRDDMSGHYLIELSDAEFQQKLETFGSLNQEQKLRLMIDRMLLAKTPDVESSSLLDLLPKITPEKTSAVWSIVATIIGDLKLFCPPATSRAHDYKNYLRRLLQSEFDTVDYSVIDDIDANTRRDFILGAAYYVEYSPVLDKLANLYAGNLSGLDPELRNHILAAKLYFSEDEVFDTWLEQYRTESDPEIKSDILSTLAGFAKQPEHLDRLIALLHEPEIVRPQDHIFLYIYLLRNHHTRDRVLDWLIQNWDYVLKLTGDKSIEDYVRYASTLIRTPEEAQKFYAFFDPKSDDPILSRSIKIAHTDIDARLRLIEHDTPAVEAKLKELAEK